MEYSSPLNQLAFLECLTTSLTVGVCKMSGVATFSPFAKKNFFYRANVSMPVLFLTIQPHSFFPESVHCKIDD